MGFKIFIIVLWTLIFIFNTLNVRKDDYKIDYLSYALLWICFMAVIISSTFFA